jgi:hypothetical protein
MAGARGVRAARAPAGRRAPAALAPMRDSVPASSLRMLAWWRHSSSPLIAATASSDGDAPQIST